MNTRTRFSKGQMLVLFTLVLPVLLGGMGLATDIGVLYFNWGILQKAADASALAGAAYLAATPLPTPQAVPAAACASYPAGGNQTANAKSAACTYVTYNGARESEATSISVPAPNVPASVPAGVQTIQVVLDRPNVPTFFLHMVGLTSLRAKAQATAMAPTAICGAGNGLFPVGVPMTPPPSTTGGTSYATWLDAAAAQGTVTLTEDPQASGNWEWLNIPDNYIAPTTPTKVSAGGNAQLASTITSGCSDCSVNLNTWLTSQPGGSGGSSSTAISAIDTRISDTNSGLTTVNSCNNSGCSNNGPPAAPAQPPADALQLVTLPIVNWSASSKINGGGSEAVPVVGFITGWLKGFSNSAGGGSSLQIVVLGTPANTQVNSGNCPPTYPGLTQAELVQ